MSPLNWVLLSKPFMGLVIFAALWFGAKAIAWGLYYLTPPSRFKTWLFKDWIAERKAKAARLR